MATMVGVGGVPGTAHVVCRYALVQRGRVPGMITGIPMNALDGDITAARPDTAAPWLDHTCTPSQHREVYPLGYVFSRAGVFTRLGLRRLIARAWPPSRVEQLSVSFTTVTMDGNSPWCPTTPRRPDGAIAARVRLLSPHHRIERDLREVSEHIPIVVLPSGFEAWPALWDFRRSQGLVTTAARTTGRFLGGMHASGPYLHGVDNASTAAAGPGEASTSFTTGVAL
ncbi:hypothetical protein ABZX95_32575 [Streptomyces sp. NPDC004232]|uniref:hypothetical protein n=1 Tax=Streptomyces sp. NPDC004232 TaxID=3154454 RepID=UPI001DEA716A|nr:hypothetical protein [Streptomyces sp. tea 10]